MKNLKTLLPLLFLVALFFNSCKKDFEEGVNPIDDTTVITPNTPTINSIMVNGSLSGMVTNQNDEALSDVEISLGANTTQTDENGYFSFKNVEINSKGSLVSAEKTGYFHNAKFVNSKPNKRNFTKIKMLEKVLSGSFMASAGGTVNTNGGAVIEFPVYGFKQEGGETYSGNVKVYATWLDPTSDDLAQKMPGDLRAIDVAEEQKQLTTYGMIGVELEGDSGQALNLATGQTATIEMPVPAALLQNAPTTIPLWHFDEASGFWIEEGEANLQGDKYIGTVGHFSFWNVDVPNSAIWLKGNVLSSGGLGLENLLIKITQNSTSAAGYATTDEVGDFAGFVPKSQQLNLTIFDNCNEVLFTGEIGPFEDDTTLPNYVLDLMVNNLVTVHGTLQDCEGKPISNGYFKAHYGANSIFEVDSEGDFSATINTCNSDNLVGTAYNRTNLKWNPPVSYDISGVSELDVGSINICDDLTEYLSFTVDGNAYYLADPSAKFNPLNGNLIIEAGTPAPDSILAFFVGVNVNAATTGFYTPFQSALVAKSGADTFDLYCDSGSSSQGSICNSLSFNITTFETIGGYVIGTMDGELNGFFTGIPHTVSAQFKAILE